MVFHENFFWQHFRGFNRHCGAWVRVTELRASFFLNPQAALIVFGGTLAATMISFEGKEVFRALGAMREIIVPSSIDDGRMMEEVQTVVDWGKINAREGKLGLEKAFEESSMTRDRFLQNSIDLFNAGYSEDNLRTKIETFVSNQYEQEKKIRGNIDRYGYVCAGIRNDRDLDRIGWDAESVGRFCGQNW